MKCVKCKDRGFIYKGSLLEGGSTCECMFPLIRIQNVANAWPSLERVEVPEEVKGFPLEFRSKNLWITSEKTTFRQHLKQFILSSPLNFSVKVRTDAELLDSWFGTAKAQGTKIFDLEIDQSTLQAIDIRDLVEPYDLTIIWMGIKELPNKESPSALLEAINYRLHVDKPTWVVDQPTRVLDGNHKFWSTELMDLMSSWSHVKVSEKGLTKTKKVSKSVEKKSLPPAQETTGEPSRFLSNFGETSKKKAKR